MRLIKAQVTKYKCVEDSEEWKTNQVTCLVGKNEAGKSALLEALHKLNPDDETQKDFVESDYPRRFAVAPEGQDDARSANVVTTTWTLNEDDCEFVNDAIPGLELGTEDEIVITKGYDNELHWTVPCDEKPIVAAIIKVALLDATESAAIRACTTVADLGEKLSRMEEKTDKQQELKDNIDSMFPNFFVGDAVGAELEERLPLFVYFKEYYKLPGQVAIYDLIQRREDPTRYSFDFKVFEALMNLVGHTPEEIAQVGKSEELITKLELIRNQLTATIFKYWSQNQHLRVVFSFDHALPSDLPPFNEGYVFRTRIENLRHQASVPFEQRSTGFIWFFSFLIWFSDVRQIYGDNLVILLDEPGLSLHGTAQKDLVNYINQELRPTFQVLYTTHSPFMIDAENIFDLRTVQDVVIRTVDGTDVHEEIKGTKVSDRILSRDRDTILPLQGAAGFDIANTMFLGPYVVVVEGPSEYAYMQWFSRCLTTRGLEGLDLRWAIAPAEGAAKVTSFVTLFSGRGLKIAALMDYHEGQKKMVNDLEKSGLLLDGHLLKTTDFAGKVEADIEDLIGWVLYRHLVNQAMRLHPQIEITEDVAAVGDQRIVKFTNEKFRTMPPGVEDFDHYKPAEYLLGVGKDEEDQLPGLDAAISRFEELFKRLNGLLASAPTNRADAP